jgi:hypothetical protein
MQIKVRNFSIITMLFVFGFQLLGIHSFASNAAFDFNHAEVIDDSITTQNKEFTTDPLSDPIYFFAEYLEEVGEEDLEEESNPKEFLSNFSHLKSNSPYRIALQTIEADCKFYSRKNQPPFSLPLYIKYLVFRL